MARRTSVEVSGLAAALLRRSPDCVTILDGDGRVALLNDAGRRAMEIDDLAEVQGREWRNLWPAASRNLIDRSLQEANEVGTSRFVAPCPTARGTPRHWDVSVDAFFDAAGRKCHVVVSRDVTGEHVVGETESRDYERLKAIRTVSDYSGHVLWDIDLMHDKVWWSEGMQSLFGYSESEIGDDIAWFHDRIRPKDRQHVVAGMEQAVADGSVFWQAEFRYRKANGDYLNVHDRGTILRDGIGKAIRFLGVMEDVTGQRATLLREQQLSRELAHRINNTLAVVSGIFQQTQATSTDLAAFSQSFSRRLLALANANSVLVRGRAGGADLEELARLQLRPFMSEQKVTVGGPRVGIRADFCQSVALVLNELATNATKHGSLSAPGGEVSLSWDIEKIDGAALLVVEWREHGGPPASAPEKDGLGSKLIEHGVPGARVTRRFGPEGFGCTIRLPNWQVLPAADG